ncbi:MAG: hypothetical protein E6J43_07455 [Chloroflexi bacterium]|nr:MAG: hypothetical protein E6J43_07455 [Chloroflexota bacterium]
MQSSDVSRVSLGRGVQVLAVALVAVAGIAAGRWLVPAGDTVSSASFGVKNSSPALASESVAPDFSAGLMIGVSFLPVAPSGLDTVDGVAAPDSSAEGHVIGIRFR